MMDLVTKEEAMHILRYDEEPPELGLFISAVSAAILNYMGEDAAYFQEVASDSEDLIPIPPEVKLATLVWMGEIDQNREGGRTVQVNSSFGYGYPPDAVIAILNSLRCPRMA